MFLRARDLNPLRAVARIWSFIRSAQPLLRREEGLELREDIDTVLEPGMVISMEPMLTIPVGQPGAGVYREHDILIITEDRNENITGFPYGPAHNVIA